MTRVIVGGGSDYCGGPNFRDIMEQFFDVKNDILGTGACRGADQEGHDWVSARGGQIEIFEADWTAHGRAAGPIRNKLMAQNADVLIAFWDSKSRGTLSMIGEALNHGLEVHVYHYEMA